MSEPFKKRVSWRFNIDGIEFELSNYSLSLGFYTFEIEETRKNGQEDSHQSGELACNVLSKEWSWRWGEESFNDYGYVKADRIIAFLNANQPTREMTTQ